jgi:ATP:ADP antiporter, AAA family
MTKDHPTLLHRLLNAHAGELGVVALAFLYNFCLLCGYYAIRPLRDTFGIERGSSMMAYLFTGTLIATLVLHPIYARLVSRLPRTVFIPIVYHFFTVVLIVFLVVFSILREPTTVTVLGQTFSFQTNGGSIALFGEQVGYREIAGYVFFIFVSVFNLFVVSVFWSLITDIFSEEQGRRFFGSLAAGGSAGAFLGGLLAWQLAEKVGSTNMIVLTIILVQMATLFVRVLIRKAPSKSSLPERFETTTSDAETVIGGSWLDGVKHVLRSPYLLGIALLMFSMTVSNTYVYLQKADIVAATFTSDDAQTAFFGMVDTYVNVATLLIQILLISRMFQAFGVAMVIVIVPLIYVLGFSALAIWQTLGVFIVLEVLTRSGRYAIMRPCRELLYSVLPRGDKYKAKNLNDTFVYRFGDQVGAWSDKAMKLLEFATPSIALVGAGVATTMGLVAFALGRKQESLAKNASAASVTSSLESPSRQ